MPKINSIAALRALLQKRAEDAVAVTTDKVIIRINQELDNYYAGNQPIVYQRTGQLAESAYVESMASNESTVSAVIRLDTDYKYNPAGRDTATIYGWAESGSLVGNGGFWARSVDYAKETLKDELRKRIKG